MSMKTGSLTAFLCLLVFAGTAGVVRAGAKQDARLNSALAKVLLASAKGRKNPVSARTWRHSGIEKAAGQEYGAYETNAARMTAIDRLAWEQVAADKMTGKEYDEFKSDLARLKALVKSGAVSGGSMPGSANRKGSGGISIAFPDTCKTPSGSGPVPVPYPNTGTTSGSKKTKDTGDSGNSATGSSGGSSGSGDEEDGKEKQEEAEIVGPQGPGGPLPCSLEDITPAMAASALRTQLAGMLQKQSSVGYPRGIGVTHEK